MGKGNNDGVTIPVKVEGLSQVLSDFNSLKSALAGLNPGGAAGVPSGASPVALTAPYAPAAPAPPSVPPAFARPYNPLQNPIIALPGVPGGAATYSVGAPALNVPPVAPAPPGAPGSTAHAGTPPPNPAGWPSGTSAWASPAPASSGGGSAPAAPPPPTDEEAGALPDGMGAKATGWGRFWKNAQRNPTVGGVFNAAYSELPLGSTAAVGAAGYAASYGMGYAFASQRPGFETETQIMATRARGQYLSPARQAAMSSGGSDARRSGG